MPIVNRATVAPVHKRALSVNEFCAAYGVGRSKTYDLIASGDLASIAIGGRRLIPEDAAEALMNMAAGAFLPAKPPPRRKRRTEA
jgi:excisionase family DNA binding protein